MSYAKMAERRELKPVHDPLLRRSPCNTREVLFLPGDSFRWQLRRWNVSEFELRRRFCQNSGLSRHGGKLTQKLGAG